MIPVNELRIGNFFHPTASKELKIPATGITYCVGSIDKFGFVQVIEPSRSASLLFSSKEIHPIVITPEILHASGFKYQDRDINATIPMRFYISECFGKHREYWLEMNFPLKPLDRFFWWLCWDIGAGRRHIHLPEGESLRHLHNLQNTWQSLAGKELVYKPVTEKA